MSTNGPMRIAGHVTAYCARCRREVVVLEGTMRCPYGNHDVEGTSLPRVPKAQPTAAVVTPLPADLATVPAAQQTPVVAEAPSDPKPATPAPQSVERIVLPDWLKEGKAWLAATERFAAVLATEDASLSAGVRQVRGLRKLLKAVLDSIEPTPGGA